jgi:histidyl-tRNA synthetase
MTESTPKGVRDFLPEEKIIRDKIIDVLRKSFELYGFNPMETPALERIDILVSKYAGGEEIVREIFKLKDQGGRELGLRYDLTVPFARVIAMNPNLKMPFKRYQIDRVWRDGPIKLGRYREFYQADADVVGTKSVAAEAEVLALAKFVFDKLGLDFCIETSNRKLLNKIIEFSGVKNDRADDVMLSLDKLKKIGESEVAKELQGKGIDKKAIDKLMKIISISGANEKILDELEKNLGKCSGIDELRELLKLTKSFGVETEITPTLARGLSYYTGTVYEAYLKKSQIKSSIAAGGRFDRMIGLLAGKDEEVPAVGISFGVDVIADAIKLEGRIKVRKSVVDAYIVPIGDVRERAISLAQALRKEGINADIDLMGRGVTKNLNFANSYGIRYVIFLGENEIKQNKVKLRDMEKGEERLLNVEEVVKILK